MKTTERLLSASKDIWEAYHELHIAGIPEMLQQGIGFCHNYIGNTFF